MSPVHRLFRGLLTLFTLGVFAAHAAMPLSLVGIATASRAWPVMPPLPAPTGLRPCCAFGYDLHAEVLGVPLPWYQLDNVARVDNLGTHRYNDSLLMGMANLVGAGQENNGIVYTRRGGFIDTAHVRDTADITVFIFTHLLSKLGQPFTLDMGQELADRRLVFSAFSVPAQPNARYTLAAWLAARLAFQLAEWHEIAQWYGFQSIPGFSEEVSAFSPEDLYSNLLGARLAVSLILNGQTASEGMYDAAMHTLLAQALNSLDAEPAAGTRSHFNMLDGHWWDSQRRVPEKFLVLRRNYQMSDTRLPTPVPGERMPPLALSLPHRWHRFSFDTLAQLQLWPASDMAQLPAPAGYYTPADFTMLATYSATQDSLQLAK